MTFISVELISIIVEIYWSSTNQFFTWKSYIACALFSIVTIVLVRRFFFLNKSYNDLQITKTRLLDLKDLYEGNIDEKNSTLLLLDEAVNYDLLGRDVIVSVLYNTISTTYSSNTYVIGLEGEWGSGKTTIANLTQQRLTKIKDIKIVKDFNFWTPGSQTALLNSMYASLLKAIGYDYDSIKMKKIIEGVLEFVKDVPEGGTSITNIFNGLVTQNEVNKLHNDLKELIINNGKRYVFFVDDLDRADYSKIRFLLKTLATVFNLPNLIFVLLYDKERIKEILKNDEQLNSAFAEKVINQEIKVPEISKEKSVSLYKRCFINLVMAYGFTEKEIKNLNKTFDLVAEKIKTVREFKRIVNSICPIVFNEFNRLNRSDLFLIQYIYFKRPDLYQLIEENSRYFIFRSPYSYMQNVDKLNQEFKKFFAERLKIYTDFIPILEELFPYVKRNNKKRIIIDRYNTRNVILEGEKQIRLYSENYFDLYFSFTQNSSLKATDTVKDFIKNVNNTKSDLRVTTIAQKFIESSTIKLVLNVRFLRIFQDRINKKKRFILATTFLKDIKSISNENFTYGMVSPRNQVLFVCSDLLKTLTPEQTNKICKIFENRYDLLLVLADLISYSKDNKALVEALNEIWIKTCKRILKEKIDLYADKYYEAYNASGLYRYAKNNKVNALSNYLNSIISNKNVYRILFDGIIESNSDRGFSYRFTNESVSEIGLDNLISLNSILKQTPPKNDSQKVVYEAYKKYKSENNSKNQNNPFDEINDRKYYKKPLNYILL